MSNSTYGAILIVNPQISFVWKEIQAGNHSGWSELAAYRLSLLLGLSHVPPALAYQAGNLIGTVSQFISGAISPNDIQFDPAKRKAIKSFVLSREFVEQVGQCLCLIC